MSRLSAAVLWIFVVLAAPRDVVAQETTVEGRPAYCFGRTGACLVGGTWTMSNGVFEITGAAGDVLELRLPNDLHFSIPAVRTLRIRTSAEHASIEGEVSLGFSGRAGNSAGLGLYGPSVRIVAGRGADLALDAFTLGDVVVPKRPAAFYLYARFSGGATVRIPGAGADVPVPTSLSGLGTELLVGFDPRAPSDMVFSLGGGFASLLTGGVVADGSLLFSSGGSGTLSLGRFVTSASGRTTTLTLRPTLAARGRMRLLRERSDTSAAEPLLPISIAGGLALDADRDRDLRPFESISDLRFAGTEAALGIEDVGLGRRLDVGTGAFFYDPGEARCPGTGHLVARAESVSPDIFSGTVLEPFDPGAAGFRFDALACGTASLVRLRAGQVRVGAFPLADFAVGFGHDGVSVEGTVRFFGSEVRLLGAVAGGALRMRSSVGLSVGGRPVTDGALELVLAARGAQMRFTGSVDLGGRRFAIDETFDALPTSISLPGLGR